MIFTSFFCLGCEDKVYSVPHYAQRIWVSPSGNLIILPQFLQRTSLYVIPIPPLSIDFYDCIIASFESFAVQISKLDNDNMETILSESDFCYKIKVNLYEWGHRRICGKAE